MSRQRVWGADIRGDDDVVCRVEEGRAAAARRRRKGNQGKEEWNSKMARPIRFRSSKQRQHKQSKHKY